MSPVKKIESPFIPRVGTLVLVEEMTATEKFYRVEVSDGEPFDYQPGQFVEVTLPGVGEVPISISSTPTEKGFFELCVRRAGRVTAVMHRMKAGDPFCFRGPYGRGFPMDELAGSDLLFIAGGIGLVPLRSAINYALAKREDYGRVTILYGTRSPAEILFREELARWEAQEGVDFEMTVDRADESWRGNVGVITTLIPKREFDPDRTVALICGPPVMYKFVLLELAEKRVPDDRILVSLERRMKCGLGKCGHCQINQYYVCKDGPVFYYSEIKGLPEAFA